MIPLEGNLWRVQIDDTAQWAALKTTKALSVSGPADTAFYSDKALNLYVYGEDGLGLEGLYNLSLLYPGERALAGGRFQNYCRDLRHYSIAFPLSESKFDEIVTWMAENNISPWSFDFVYNTKPPTEDISDFRRRIKMRFHFEDVEQAVLCRLSF